MEKKFIYNFSLFTLILLICVGSFAFILISGDKEIDKIDDLVLKTNEIIVKTEKIATLTEAMLADQRAYLLTNKENFIQQYKDKKQDFLANLDDLYSLNKNNQDNRGELNQIKKHFDNFSLKLEERAIAGFSSNPDSFVTGISEVSRLKEAIINANEDILENSYRQLNTAIILVEAKKDQYFKLLIICLVTSTILLLMFNAFLLKAQVKGSKVQSILDDSEKRYELIIESTQDGVFDWDIIAGTVFYSAQFFKMLGYNSKGVVGTTDNFSKLLHPSDKKEVWAYVDECFEDPTREYKQKFRMRGKDGKWIWVRSRAKIFFNRKGKPVRMVGLHTNITEDVQSQQKLTSAKKIAEEASKAKGEFLAHMSHEIRTPLTAISGIAEILQKSAANLNEKQKKLVKTLVTSSNSLKDIITDVLDFSKIENHEIDLDQEVFPLKNLFEEVISIMSMRAKEKKIKFKFNYAPLKDIEFYGDKTRLRQILVNLISNSIKFTDKGSVKVKAYIDKKTDPEIMRIDVSDTGIGIAKKDFDNIFKRFKQADSSVSRKYGGTGLGLPISRNLAQLMGGNIFFESKVGKGSVFSLVIPATIVENDHSHEKHVTDQPSYLDDQIKEIATGKRLLVVEDYEPNIIYISHFLDDLNLSYDVAETGIEAVKMWSKKKKNPYGLILMDVQMPEMDGLTATQKIREKESKKKKATTPIIGMTAHALIEDRNKCINAGMDAYLPKPIVENDLKKLLLFYLKR